MLWARVVPVLVLSLWAGVAGAHHQASSTSTPLLPGAQGASAGGPLASHVALRWEFASASGDAVLNAVRSHGIVLRGSYVPSPGWALSVEPSWLVLDEPGRRAIHGLGNTAVEVLHQPGAGRGRGWTLGMRASLPTRSPRYRVDPGRVWQGSPSASHGWALGEWRVQGSLAVIADERPAGLSLDALLAAAVAYRGVARLDASLLLLGQMRVAAFCERIGGGRGFCGEGRVTEVDRPTGAVRAYASPALSVRVGRNCHLSLATQVPLTLRRDFDFRLNAGVRLAFGSPP